MELEKLKNEIDRQILNHRRISDFEWELTANATNTEFTLILTLGSVSGESIFVHDGEFAHLKLIKHKLAFIFGEIEYSHYPLSSDTFYNDVAGSMIYTASSDLDSNIPTAQRGHAQSSLCP